MVTGQEAEREFACLVGEDGVTGVVYVCVHIAEFAANELGRLEGFKGNGLLFGGSDIFSALIEVPFGSFHSFGEVLLDVVDGEQWPSNEVAGLDGFEPGGLDGVSTHCMHPSDGLFGGWEVVYAVGLAEDVSCLLGWVSRLPSSFVLGEWDAVASMCVAVANKEGFALASDEHVGVFVDGDTGLSEDGDGAIIAGFTNAH
jgi:hypothetical protein